MDGESSTKLQHVGSRGTSALQPSRTSVISRGRRDAAATAANPHYVDAVAAYRAGEIVKAAQSFYVAAGQGHAESQYILSTLYEAGEGVTQDAAAAALWERKAAEQGHAYAQANLSYRYYVAGDFAQAFAWCQRAAYTHLAWAQYHLGLMYRKGEGTVQDDTQAAQWYKLAAEQAYADAQAKLAEMYYWGHGVPVSYAIAAVWYRRAATQGHAEAQFQLGHLYAVGQGVELDYVQSRHWITQAALQGHKEAAREFKARQYRDPA